MSVRPSVQQDGCLIWFVSFLRALSNPWHRNDHPDLCMGRGPTKNSFGDGNLIVRAFFLILFVPPERRREGACNPPPWSLLLRLYRLYTLLTRQIHFIQILDWIYLLRHTHHSAQSYHNTILDYLFNSRIKWYKVIPILQCNTLTDNINKGIYLV